MDTAQRVLHFLKRVGGKVNPNPPVAAPPASPTHNRARLPPRIVDYVEPPKVAEEPKLVPQEDRQKLLWEISRLDSATLLEKMAEAQYDESDVEEALGPLEYERLLRGGNLLFFHKLKSLHHI